MPPNPPEYSQQSTSNVSSLSGSGGVSNVDYVIRPPSTSGDDGSPTDSLLKDVRRVLAMIQDERHLVAHDLYCNVRDRINQGPVIVPSPKRKGMQRRAAKKQHKAAQDAKQEDYRVAKELFASRKAEFEKLETVARLFRHAKEELTEEGDWIYSQTSFGVATYYRREANGSLSIKLDGALHGVPLFEQVAVLREVDLHYKWVPFCTSSLTVKQLDKIDVVGWFVTGLPTFGLMRDGCFRAIGCDSIWEDGKIYLMGQGVADRDPANDTRDPDDRFLSDDPAIQDLDIPPPPTRIGAGRMTIQKFHSVIEILSPTSAKTRIVANINPNLDFVPQSLIDFLMRKLCGVVVNKLQNAAAKCTKEPVKNAHARRMRQQADFYEGWLQPKFQDFCDSRGWAMSSIRALELTEEEREKARAYEKVKYKKMSRSTVSNPAVDMSSGNSVAHSEPIFPTLDDDTEVSDLSTTSSVWRKNPISGYLRELERKAQLRKADDIAKARKRAADRLKKHKLTKEETSRLKELKKVKARRLKNASSPRERAVSGGTEAEQARKMVRWTEKLHHHGPYTRFLVVSILFSVMVAVFHAPGVSSRLTHHSESLWESLLQNLGTLVFLSFCAAAHFLLCDVSFVYAFDSLDLGMKTGSRTKQYYGGIIHLVGAVSSCGIAAGSIARALLVSGCREAFWYALQLREYVKGVFGSDTITQSTEVAGEMIKEAGVLFPLLGKVGSFVLYMVSLATKVSASVIDWMNALAIRSHWVGRTTQDLMYWSLTGATSLSERWNQFKSKAIASHDGSLELPSWRSNAIDTSIFLLMYSAVFIVTILFLFNISTSKPEKSKETVSEISVDTSTEVHSAPLSPTSTLEIQTRTTAESSQSTRQRRQVARWKPSFSKSGGLQHEVIHEGDESGFQQEESLTAPSDMPNHVVTPSLASGSTKPKKRGLRKLKLRRKKSGGDDESAASSGLKNVRSEGSERDSYPDLRMTHTM